ncbi:putative mitochondrial DNA-directed RNA polymerase [Aspergillus steynii IBT 23096]|uniref:DNA-directed RNA polymerase n=1 Tax=Aspergillus steynii IBT 23096 TaxID=1392250 RepID=A0A2I2GDW6_9EURO|nr:putative mitochondrial DNA-directed RNA polymerase [Aspergillus steynii IBT 23096]PLB51062.1 putative mitochondrial DNA-directed RNA polymerase [Aspergillus steynii IBT 23096]
MLSRVARQKTALPHPRLLNSCRLSPTKATLRFHSSRPNPLTNAPTTISQERSRLSSLQSNRNLATSADQSALEQGLYPETQYDRVASLFPPITTGFDPSSLIIINDAPQTQPRSLRFIKGIGGDEEEMMANLDISLKVFQFDRAASLINRLSEFHPVGSNARLALHNRYLQAMVSHMIVTRQHSMILPLQRWFEVDMPNGGSQPNATTYAVMLRMALRMLHSGKRDRTVRRYWEFAKTAGVEEEVLAVPVLSELDLGELSEICSSDLQRVAIGSMDVEQDDLIPLAPDAPAEVRPVDQKGLGLSTLKDSLSTLSGSSGITMPENTTYTPEQNQELHTQLRQRQLETDSIRVSLERWRHEFDQMQKSGIDTTTGNKRFGPIMSQWHSGLVSKIKEELELVDELQKKPSRTFDDKQRQDYGVYLRSLEPEKLAAITLLSVISTFTRGGMEKGMKVAAVVTTIGKELQDELMAQEALRKVPDAETRRIKTMKDILSNRKTKDGRSRWHGLVKSLHKDDSMSFWSSRVRARVGALLMSLLFDAAKVPASMEDPDTKQKETIMQPAFQHSYEISWGRRQGYIHLNPEVVKLIAKEPPADVLGRHLPMLCKPKPWKEYKDGGYFMYKNSIVRTTPGESLQPSYIVAALQNNGLEQVRSSLDILGNTGWTINGDVFNVMLEAWNSGEAIANLAPLHPDLPHPPRPHPDEGHEAVRKWQTVMRDIENRRSGMHSNRCFQNFQLEVARAYLNETFYLPHNMDFRGRAYPLPVYLNQMGADNARGLLLFSEAKPLGAGGMRWLKIQIANLAGFDKASLSEREQFATDHLDDILDSANQGLHGKRWWLQAEDPWQCLAACCELRNALQLSDPTEYLSRLPIHQDGSCNGLQHYAALGGDKVGAQQVNLEPSDRPSDVYTGVAEFVKEAVAAEAAQGEPSAKLLHGRVTRKIVKQTVMTNVYGVTFIGAMKQVRRQLVDHYPDLSIEQAKDGALYIARKIFEALGTMFNGAHEIQYWLGDCASRITQSISPEQVDEIAMEALTPQSESDSKKPKKKGSDPAEQFRTTVIWTTPLGLPVVQPYRTRKARRIPTSLQDLSIVDATSAATVSKRKQLQAFPPNFIHSLDATHMMMSATACYRAGLTFSAVHDSFWTHASDVDKMNEILREAFVRMHSDDVVKRLAAEFEVRYGQNLFLAKVKSNTTLGKAIRTYRRHKRTSKTQELLAESKRQKLLKSDDPDLQAQGRQMITPASIFEQLGATDKDLNIASSLGEAVVGHVPEDLEAAERRTWGMDADVSDPAIASLTGGLDSFVDLQKDTAGEDETDGAGEEEPKRRGTYHGIWFWLPLRFREVPERGTWDLTRIRNSKYFFS